MTAALRITGLSVLSAAGIGPDALGDQLRTLAAGEGQPAGATGTLAAGDDYGAVPGAVSAVPHFDIADFVPRKGTRNLDRTTKLGIAATAQLRQRLAATAAAWERTGVAIGSMAGSVRSAIDLGASVLEGSGMDLVNPATFPNTTMNCCASQIAIWHRLRGPNSTLANGAISALSALRYAARLIRCGHAERMLVGGVEELSPHTAWATRLKKEVDESVFIGEGAAMLALETGDPDVAPLGVGPVLGMLSACAVQFAPERNEPGYAGALGRAVDRALATSGTAAGDIDLVLPGAVGTALWPSEAAVVDRFDTDRIDVRAAVGECGSALTAMQLAAALLTGGPGRTTLVTGLDVSGAVGAVVLTTGGPAQC
jgi:3-oxoacyl-[acyl-carrier-protein] synthase II